jgi:hypothetical protein
MIADPLRDVGLRREKALLQRPLPRELQVLLLAQIGLSNLADHHHDLNESHWRHRPALPRRRNLRISPDRLVNVHNRRDGAGSGLASRHRHIDFAPAADCGTR